MVAHFYLLAVSFHNNANFNKEEIEEKIKRLSEDITLIHKYKDTNKFYVNYSEVYPQVVYSTYTVEDFICRGPEMRRQGFIERDVLNALNNIMQTAEETAITFQEVQGELLSWIDKDNCHGLIAFHKISNFDNDLQIIYGKDEWYRFRRHFLSLYPCNENFFIDECAKYFPNLYFHDRNKTVVSHLLKDSTRKLVHYLSELNDKFSEAKTTPYDRKLSLIRFNSMCSFDQDASDEGNSGSKKKSKVQKKDTFEFTNKYNNKKKVCCDLHLKILKNDKGTISNDRRIYINEGVKDIGFDKILVGHMGRHI
jgi:hypothetical protein